MRTTCPRLLPESARSRVEPETFQSQVVRSNHYTTRPQVDSDRTKIIAQKLLSNFNIVTDMMRASCSCFLKLKLMRGEFGFRFLTTPSSTIQEVWKPETENFTYAISDYK